MDFVRHEKCSLTDSELKLYRLTYLTTPESYLGLLSTHVFNHQASQGEEEVNLLRQEVNNLKARLQRAASPRRESPGVGAGSEDQVAQVDLKSEPHLMRSLLKNDLSRFLYISQRTPAIYL